MTGEISLSTEMFKSLRDGPLSGATATSHGNIRVVHLKRHPDCHSVDRSTDLGNPFDLRSEADRPIVVRAHKEYTWLIVAHGKEPIEAAQIVLARHPGLTLARAWRRPTRARFMAALGSLEDAARRGDCAIGCWCAPRACHGDNYKGFLEWRLSNENRA